MDSRTFYMRATYVSDVRRSAHPTDIYHFNARVVHLVRDCRRRGRKGTRSAQPVEARAPNFYRQDTGLILNPH